MMYECFKTNIYFQYKPYEREIDGKILKNLAKLPLINRMFEGVSPSLRFIGNEP